MKTILHLLTVLVLSMPALQAQTIPNQSFEAQTFANSPGYASGNGGVITGWNIHGNARLNPAGGQNPFADNGAIPQRNHVAFLQSSGDVPAVLSTTITGLTAGVKYLVTFRVNARNATGGNGVGANWYINTAQKSALGILINPVGGSNPYQTVDGTFTAPGAITRVGANIVGTAIAGSGTLSGTWPNTNQTAITGNGSPRTFTIPAPVNGVPKRFHRVQVGRRWVSSL